MFIETCTSGVLLHVSVRTCQKEFRLVEKGGRILAHVASEPERDRANKGLVNGPKNIFNQPVFLVSGAKSKTKKLKIENITAETAMQILEGIAGK